MTLSVVIITKNEERNIGNCLKSVKWADEIIVVDAFSQDKTAEIAKQYTDKVAYRKWDNFLNQRSFALRSASCDMVLIMDADEILDKDAQDDIRGVLTSSEVYNGYHIIRDTYFLGKRLIFSQRPESIIRLFRKDKGFIVNECGQRGHEHYGVHQHTAVLNGRLEHHTAHTIAERLEKIDRYSTLWAEEQAEHGKPKYLIFKMTYGTTKSFMGNFFVRRGFLDGFHGFIWCTLKAMEHFLKYSKLLES